MFFGGKLSMMNPVRRSRLARSCAGRWAERQLAIENKTVIINGLKND
jgi:hypothetical protein